jgi:hypothetical protein
MTLSRIQALEILGFEWESYSAAWDNRFSELADYRKIQGHCNVPKNYNENSKLAAWVKTQRSQYRLHKEGKTSSMTNFRIQALEDIGFKWCCFGATWEVRLSELADYRRIHGHCNVPTKSSENSNLGVWVANQRSHYRLHLEGRASPMTSFRIQALKDIGLESGCCKTVWEDRLSELAEYRKVQGHCNIPSSYSENSKLANWVGSQRSHNRLHREGKRSQMTLPRIQALESLDFEWSRVCVNAWKDRLNELADYRKIYGHCNVPRNYSESTKLANWVDCT